MNPLPIVPLPRDVELRQGRRPTPTGPWRVHPDSLKHIAVGHRLGELTADIVPDPALPPHAVVVGDAPTALLPPPEAEGYALSIGPSGIAVVGRNADGLFYGLVTLQQLIEADDDLPCCAIRDWPATPLRGHHDDVSRKQVSTLDDFRRILRHLARFKINGYTPYLEDMLFLRSHPDIGATRGHLTPDEVAGLLEEAERQNIVVFPTFSLVGHQENLLAMPQYRHLAREVFQSPSSLDPDKPAVREFLREVIADVCELFPGPYFHMGFDETQGLAAEPFLRHANWCAEEVVRHGKTPVMWVDMVYNHFGYEAIRDLHPAIVPVNWNYRDTSRPILHQDELEAQGRDVWGLAGYGGTCSFLPDFASRRPHFDAWAGHFAERDQAALFASQWGDEGYENSRDLPWNLFAAFGEAAWRGAGSWESFDERFERVFYGAELPALRRIERDLPAALSLSPREFWQMHRRNASTLFRYAASAPQKRDAVAADLARVGAALVDLDACRAKATREASHLDHFEVSLRRMRSVLHRLLFAFDHAGKPDSADRRRDAAAIRDELLAVRDRYEQVWLRHNKRPNIEVSLGVFDRMADSYAALVEPADVTYDAGRYRPLSLAGVLNTFFLDIAGMPVGRADVDGVPFEFADLAHTHVLLDAATPEITLDFGEPLAIADLHLAAMSPAPADKRPVPGLRVELLRGENIVFAEDLDRITHLCDWWAPRGEHIWAGGGLAHVDADRLDFLLSPNHFYGLTCIRRFDLPAGLRADHLRLRRLDGAEVQVFAATVETAPS